MASQITPGAIVEVPLPSNYPTQQCLPLVVQVPSSNLSDYMLKSVFAVNGSPGVVDHATLADMATAVEWSGVLNPPIFGDMDSSDYASNGQPGVVDEAVLAQTVLYEMVDEGVLTISAGSTNGQVLLVSTLNNPFNAVYTPATSWLYDASQVPGPAGHVHVDIWDYDAAAWVNATASTDISALNTGLNALLKPVFLSGAGQRTFEAAPAAIKWRVVLDTAPGTACTLRAGIRFNIYAAPNL